MVGVMMRCESLDAGPTSVITLAANAAQDVLPDRTSDGTTVAYRFIQNLSGADMYYSIGSTASIQANMDDYHGIIPSKTQLSVPTKRRVSVFSIGGGKVSTLELFKNGL